MIYLLHKCNKLYCNEVGAWIYTNEWRLVMTRCVIITRDGPVVAEEKEFKSIWEKMDCKCEVPNNVDEQGEVTTRCYNCGYTVRADHE